jgi:site-specific DNA-cytosine methylase
MRSLDLFSCIGCHARGFERAGFETVALCEINPWRRARLREQWPDTPIYDDARQPIPIKADIVVGGPPCQRTAVSAAIHGYRTGETLWPAMLARGLDAGAKWLVVEQPPSNEEWERGVCADMASAGYHVARAEFAASDLGAPYQRRRVYLVGSASLARLEIAWSSIGECVERIKRAAAGRNAWCPDQLSALPVVARDAGEMDRGERSRERKEWIEALGDSNPPEMAEVIARAIMTNYGN